MSSMHVAAVTLLVIGAGCSSQREPAPHAESATVSAATVAPDSMSAAPLKEPADFVSLKAGRYQIASALRPTYCLDLPSQTDSDSDGHVQLASCNTADNQKWTITPVNGAARLHEISIPQLGDKFMGKESGGNELRWGRRSSGLYTRWRFEQVGATTYKIVLADRSSCIDHPTHWEGTATVKNPPPGAPHGRGSTLQVLDCRGVNAQVWEVRPAN